MAYSKLGNIKGPQGRRGLNMTGGATTPPTVDDSVLEGDLWLDSTTGDVYMATDPLWAKDGTWHTWGTVLWKVDDDILMVQPAEGGTGTTGEPADFGYFRSAPWGVFENNPSVSSMTSVRSKERIAMNANSAFLFCDYDSLTDISALSDWGTSNVPDMNAAFYRCTSLTDLSPISGWDVSGVKNMESMFYDCTSLIDISALSGWGISGVTNMGEMFSGCSSLTDISPLSGWDMSGVTSMAYMFNQCPVERIGIPSLEHGGRNFVSMLEDSYAVTDMDTAMLTNTTTHETMSANQILTDMDANPSKYATGTIWTTARA